MKDHQGKKVLFWGRGDYDYSRNRIVLDLMNDLGFCLDFFSPRISRFGKIEAGLKTFDRPDLIWVPCFRHSDVTSAAHYSEKWQVPLVFDPLISAYQKEVFERKKWPESSIKAKNRKKWETDILSRPDIIVCDTYAHSDYFCKTFSIPENKLYVLYVGAEELVFTGEEPRKPEPPFNILFYGSFLELQGANTIIEAAQLNRSSEIIWTLVGEGPCLEEAKQKAEGLKNVVFKPWMSYSELKKNILKADIVLGVFGNTIKADMVIPNKVFQAMASGKPLITRKARAYRENIHNIPEIGWVEKQNPESLSGKVTEWLEKPNELKKKGQAAKRLFDQYFARNRICSMLEEILNAACDCGNR